MFIPSTCTAVQEATQVGHARRTATECARTLGFTEEERGIVGVIVTEAANNLVKHARQGMLLFRRLTAESGSGLEVLSIDHVLIRVVRVVLRDLLRHGHMPLAQRQLLVVLLLAPHVVGEVLQLANAMTRRCTVHLVLPDTPSPEFPGSEPGLSVAEFVTRGRTRR